MDRSLGKWKLPQPTDLKDEELKEWIQIPRIARTIPFGYKINEKDSELLDPIPYELEAVELARKYVNQYSYRQVANWLTQKTGREISHVGLRKRLMHERQRKNKARTLRKWSSMPRKQSKRRKRLKKAEQEQKPKVSIVEEIEEVPIEEQNIIFRPNEGPQTEFLAAPEREVLYGGSAGGGKSYAMLADPLRYMGHPSFSGLLLRHTTEELRELIFKSKEIYPQIWKGIKWSERKMQWEAPSGARLWMSYLDRDDDVLRYQGLAFSWIGFDELTQWSTPYAWNYMRSRLRSTAPDLPVYMRATTNPGGPGHQWVKKMFIDPAPYGKTFDATNIETGKVLQYPSNHEKAGQPLFQERFISARLSDNLYLSSQKGDYESNASFPPEQQRKQLLEGDWDIKEGAAFTEFNRNVHVVEPFDIPNNWVKFRACDLWLWLL